MRFLHAADIHLGGHRDPALRAASERAFATLTDDALAQKPAFLLLAGDLFNTAIPGIDALKVAVTHLSRLRDARIPVYAIGGSHDASPTGKSMLDVLERAGLLIDVGRGEERDGAWNPRVVTDPATGLRITGVPGRAGMLDHQLWERFDRHAITDPARTILLVHTAIQGLHDVPGSLAIDQLPPGCAYYAGGHVHLPSVTTLPGVGTLGFPGPTFPNSFSEIEELQHGGYLRVELQGQVARATRHALAIAPVRSAIVNASGMQPGALDTAIRDQLDAIDVTDAIVTLRVEGTLAAGEPTDLDLRAIARETLARGARAFLRNTVRLRAPELSTDATSDLGETQDVESAAIDAHRDQLTLAQDGVDGAKLARALLAILSREQQEGERLGEYRERVTDDALREIADALVAKQKRPTSEPLNEHDAVPEREV